MDIRSNKRLSSPSWLRMWTAASSYWRRRHKSTSRVMEIEHVEKATHKFSCTFTLSSNEGARTSTSTPTDESSLSAENSPTLSHAMTTSPTLKLRTTSNTRASLRRQILRAQQTHSTCVDRPSLPNNPPSPACSDVVKELDNFTFSTHSLRRTCSLPMSSRRPKSIGSALAIDNIDALNNAATLKIIESLECKHNAQMIAANVQCEDCHHCRTVADAVQATKRRYLQKAIRHTFIDDDPPMLSTTNAANTRRSWLQHHSGSACESHSTQSTITPDIIVSSVESDTAQPMQLPQPVHLRKMSDNVTTSHSSETIDKKVVLSKAHSSTTDDGLRRYLKTLSAQGAAKEKRPALRAQQAIGLEQRSISPLDEEDNSATTSHIHSELSLDNSRKGSQLLSLTNPTRRRLTLSRQSSFEITARGSLTHSHSVDIALLSRDLRQLKMTSKDDEEALPRIATSTTTLCRTNSSVHPRSLRRINKFFRYALLSCRILDHTYQ